MSERRIQTRIEHRIDATVKIQSAPAAPVLEGVALKFDVRNLSLEGLQLQVSGPVPVGALLELKIKLHGTDGTYWHTGNVVWHDPKLQRIGVRFDNTANPQYNSWKDAIAKLIPGTATVSGSGD